MLYAGVLQHGGVMVNYRCTAACRHCLYACSGTREAGYITAAMAREVSGLLAAGGCGSVHIGGGEPFLDFEGLLTMIRELGRAKVALDYVETNAFWAGDDRAAGWLKTLLAEGVGSLCISLDPYHAEYVPYGAPLRLAERCDQAGMGYFLWQQQFLPALSGLEPDKAHSRAEMEGRISPAYIHDTARRYGIGYGGRAINIEEEYVPRRPLAELLRKSEPCRGLLSTGHFHVDLHGFFIPPGCTGLRLPLAELLKGIPPEKYPVYEMLYQEGIRGLLRLAETHGFRADPAGYPSACNLCFHARRHLARQGFAELDAEHYEESLRYYPITPEANPAAVRQEYARGDDPPFGRRRICS